MKEYNFGINRTRLNQSDYSIDSDFKKDTIKLGITLQSEMNNENIQFRTRNDVKCNYVLFAGPSCIEVGLEKDKEK